MDEPGNTHGSYLTVLSSLLLQAQHLHVDSHLHYIPQGPIQLKSSMPNPPPITILSILSIHNSNRVSHSNQRLYIRDDKQFYT